MTPPQAAAKRATFDWQFCDNPHNDGRSPFFLAIADAEVVGVNGMMPIRIIHRGAHRMAGWSCDSRVSDRFRGRGIVVELVRRQQDEVGIMLGYGITDSMDRALTKVGWDTSRELAAYFFYAHEPGAKGALKNLRTRIYRASGRIFRRAVAEITVQSNADFGPEVDELWARSAPTYCGAVERDAAYLNWKYRRHPQLSYCWYAARQQGKLVGLLVARPEAHASVIVDYCGPLADDALMTDLVDAVVRDLCDRGTAGIRCETTDEGMARALRQNGFRESPGIYRFRGGCSAVGAASPIPGFFVMTGDSDTDLTATLNVSESVQRR
jgi:hypothetical protein